MNHTYAYYRQKFPNITPERAQQQAVLSLKKIPNADLYLSFALSGQYNRIPSAYRQFLTAVAMDIRESTLRVDPYGVSGLPLPSHITPLGQPSPQGMAIQQQIEGFRELEQHPLHRVDKALSSSVLYHLWDELSGRAFSVWDAFWNVGNPQGWWKGLTDAFTGRSPVMKMSTTQRMLRLFRPLESAVAGFAGLIGGVQGAITGNYDNWALMVAQELVSPQSPAVISERVLLGLDKWRYHNWLMNKKGKAPVQHLGGNTLLDWVDIAYREGNEWKREKIPVNEVEKWHIRQQMGEISDLRVGDTVYRSKWTADLGFMTLNLPMLVGGVLEGLLPVSIAGRTVKGIGAVGAVRFAKSPLKHLDDFVKAFRTASFGGKAALVYDLGQQLVWLPTVAPFIMAGKPLGLFRATGGQISNRFLQRLGEQWGALANKVLVSHYLANTSRIEADRFLRVWGSLKRYAAQTRQRLTEVVDGYLRKRQSFIEDLTREGGSYRRNLRLYQEALAEGQKVQPPVSPLGNLMTRHRELFEMFPRLQDELTEYLEKGVVGETLVDFLNPVSGDLLRVFGRGGGVSRWVAEQMLRLQGGIDRAVQHRVGRYFYPLVRLFSERLRAGEDWVRMWAGQRLASTEEAQRMVADIANLFTGNPAVETTKLYKALQTIAKRVADDHSVLLTDGYNELMRVLEEDGFFQRLGLSQTVPVILPPNQVKALLDMADDAIRKGIEVVPPPQRSLIHRIIVNPRIRPLIENRDIFTDIHTLASYNLPVELGLRLLKVYDDVSVLRQKNPDLVSRWQKIALDFANNQPIDPREFASFRQMALEDPVLSQYTDLFDEVFEFLDKGGGIPFDISPTKDFLQQHRRLTEAALRYTQRVADAKTRLASANPCV